MWSDTIFLVYIMFSCMSTTVPGPSGPRRIRALRRCCRWTAAIGFAAILNWIYKYLRVWSNIRRPIRTWFGGSRPMQSLHRRATRVIQSKLTICRVYLCKISDQFVIYWSWRARVSSDGRINSFCFSPLLQMYRVKCVLRISSFPWKLASNFLPVIAHAHIPFVVICHLHTYINCACNVEGCDVPSVWQINSNQMYSRRGELKLRPI